MRHFKIKGLFQPCVFCHDWAWRKLCICSSCQQQLTSMPDVYCPTCALPYANNVNICTKCMFKDSPFNQVWASFQYEPLIQYLIHQMKFENQVNIAKFLGYCLADCIELKHAKWDVITSVPIHRLRWLKRGFNQSEVMARIIAKTHQIPYQNLIKKICHTPAMSLNRTRRSKISLRNVFRVTKPPAKRILLVDDVMTSGCTAYHLADCLKKAGAASIDLAVAVRVVL